MGASKGSPANQMLEWAVGKIDEASKTDWVEKFSSLTASKPAYLRGASLTPAAPSLPAPAPAGDGVSLAELDAALARATQAEAKAARLARRVAQLEAQRAGTNSHSKEVLVPEPVGAAVEGSGGVEGDGGDEDEHRPHWWSRKH